MKLAILPAVLALALAGSPSISTAQSPNPIVIEQSRGIDQRVNYQDLTRFGPWDDRNYMLTADDVAMLPEDDYYLYNVPAFWKVEYRKSSPEMQGWNMYPRSMDQEFQMRFGGLMQNGVIAPKGLGKQLFAMPQKYPFKDATRTTPVLSNIVLDNGTNRNECTIEFNPADQDKAIAGCNGTGQEQYFSTNGGATWAISGNLPNTCCDPSLEWSVDGTVAYAATLGNTAGLRATTFRSTDGGATWNTRIDVSNAASDKEWIHVDRTPGSPHLDNVYLSWHQGNVVQFARSTDRGQSWSTPIAFAGAQRGIGSDLTTSPNGDVYYFYPSLNTSTGGACAAATPCNIVMLKSTNGGASFVNPNGTQIATMRGRFEASIPSMESRRIFMYVSTDVDKSNGPRRGRIYVSWTDLALRTPANNSAASTTSNNTRIRIIYSDNGGDTWTELASPHEIESTTTDSCAPAATAGCVDRYHQWIDVDDNGMLHVGYYDTRNDLPNRGRVDFYYTYSNDGGATWDLPPTRVSTESSNNITNGQEYGDYNGLTVSLVKNKIMGVWTDNRTGQGQKAVAAEIQLPSAGTYTVNAPGTATQVCQGQTAGPLPISILTTDGATSPVTLATAAPPATFGTATFVPNPVVPSAAGAISNLTVAISGTAPAGAASLPITGTAGATVINGSVPFQVFVGNPGTFALTAPANAAAAVPLNQAFSWAAASNSTRYRVEISPLANFSTLSFSGVATGTSFTAPTALRANTTYFWRVRAENPCTNGSYVQGTFTTVVGDTLFSDGFFE